MNVSDPLNCRDRMSLNTTYYNILFSEAYLRLWTFLIAHGEKHNFCPNLDKNLPAKRMHGKCIMEAAVQSELWLERKPIKHNILDYAEGLCSYKFLSLHAWNVLSSNRHSTVIDLTWEIPKNIAKHVWYQGVIFSREFFDWIRNEQVQSGYKDTLPYLASGSCCLTYKPLLEGKISDYPIKDGDRDKAASMLQDLFDSIMDINDTFEETDTKEGNLVC